MHATRVLAAVGAMGLSVAGASAADWSIIDNSNVQIGGAIVFDTTPSAYVQEAQSGFKSSPAGGRFIGPVIVRAPLPGEHGWRANSTGRPIGGGPRYGDWVSPPPEGFVRTFAGLESALNRHLEDVRTAIAKGTAMPRRTIFIDPGVEIELGDATLVIAPGVTLASSRGLDGSPGGVLKSSSDSPGASFVVLSRHNLGTTRQLAPVRITGLRLQGPNGSQIPPNFTDCTAKGRTAIFAHEDNHQDPANIVDRVLEIDNNEFGAWPAAAIQIEGVRGGYVHHNYIHHSQRNPQEQIPCAVVFRWHAKGYGVAVDNSLVYIEANRFATNRHAIASSGNEFTDYIAMYNVLVQEGPSHHFDVHGGQDRNDGTHIAGRNIVIAFNTDYGSEEDSINIRGNPASGAWVIGNQFRGTRDNIKQTKVPVTCQSVAVPTGRGGVYWTNVCKSHRMGLTVADNIYNYREPGTPGTPGPGWQPGAEGNPTQQE